MPIKRAKPERTGVKGILKDGRHRFLVCVTYEDPKTGRERRRRAVASSLVEAIELQKALRDDPLPEKKRTRLSFRDYATAWLEEKRPDLQPASIASYEQQIAHLCVEFGDYRIDGIQPGDVRRWQMRAARKNSNSTVNSRLGRLRQILTAAFEDGLTDRNPAKVIRALKEGRTQGRRGRALTASQLRKFVETARAMGSSGELAPDLSRMLEVLAWTGLRRGELLALKWGDLIEGELHVTRAICTKTKKSKVTKTDDPRIVTVPEPLADVLQTQRTWLLRQQHEGLPSDLMFPANPKQAWIGARRRGLDRPTWIRTLSCLDKPISKVVGKGSLPEISAHSLRRTYENVMRRAGVDAHVRRTLAGWRNEGTQAIYAGVDPEERKAAGVAFASLVMAPKTPTDTLRTPDQKEGY